MWYFDAKMTLTTKSIFTESIKQLSISSLECLVRDRIEIEIITVGEVYLNQQENRPDFHNF